MSNVKVEKGQGIHIRLCKECGKSHVVQKLTAATVDKEDSTVSVRYYVCSETGNKVNVFTVEELK